MGLFRNSSAQWLRTLLGVFFLCLLLFPQESYCQTQNDHDDIHVLMKVLSDQTIQPSDALNPDTNPSIRDKELQDFEKGPYQIVVNSTGEITFHDPSSATVPIYVSFKAGTLQFEADTEAQFIKVNGRWYFANYDFLHFSAFLIVVVIFCCLIGVSYGTGGLLVWWKLTRQGNLPYGISWFKIFIPFFWPSILRGRSFHQVPE